MSSALTGTQIKNTYQSLLKFGGNGSLDPTNAVTISDGLGNDTPLQIAGNKILTNYVGNSVGLSLHFGTSIYQIGDYNALSTNTYLRVNVNGEQIITGGNGGFKGLNLDGFNKSYQFGDFATTNNGTSIIIDDDNEGVTIKANVDLAFVGTGLENTGAGSSSGKFLRILVNGNEYKIDLLDP
jgi:hypothetical protein